MTKIYLIRHAEAEGNLYRRAQGQYDSTVTPLGRRQIAALAERFRDIPIDALWSSDLCRTQSTAAAILKYHPQLTLHTTPLLREFGLGVWEDTPWGNLARDNPEQMRYFSTDPDRFRVEGSESFPKVAERMEQVLLSIAAENEGGTVAVFSHGMAIRGLICRLRGVPSHEIHRIPHGDNTAVAELRAEEGRLLLDSFNDNGHLDDSCSTFARQTWWRNADGDRSDADNVLFEPLRLPEEEELYTRCYEATWLQSHGNLDGFCPALYRQTARMHAAEDARMLMKMIRGGRFAGLIELDPLRGREHGAGWISLIYVEPEFRSRRLGIQLLGHAVALFRRMGRDFLRLHVSQTNTEALGFYQYSGFRILEEVPGVGGPLYLMEMDIRRHIYRLP